MLHQTSPHWGHFYYQKLKEINKSAFFPEKSEKCIKVSKLRISYIDTFSTYFSAQKSILLLKVQKKWCYKNGVKKAKNLLFKELCVILGISINQTWIY